MMTARLLLAPVSRNATNRKRSTLLSFGTAIMAVSSSIVIALLRRRQRPYNKQTQAIIARSLQIKSIFDEFNSADHYLFSVPMWNFNIPYKLKHYIDIVTQPGMSWSYTPEDGYKGLMTDKTATIIYATGDGYSEGTGFESFDMQKPYVNLWLTFLGFKQIEKVVIDRTLFDAETAEKNALDVALKLANINTL